MKNNMRNERNHIEAARKAKGWKTAKLVEVIAVKAGIRIGQDTVRRHERGVRAVSPLQQIAYAIALNKPITALFDGYDMRYSEVVFLGHDTSNIAYFPCKALFKLVDHGGDWGKKNPAVNTNRQATRA